MPTLFNPRFDLLLGGLDIQSVADLNQFLERFPSPLGSLGTEPLNRAHELCDRLSVPGDDDLPTLFDLVDQPRQMSLGVKNSYMFHRLSYLTS